MRYIVKNVEPSDFSQWKIDNPSAVYNDLNSEYVIKQSLKNSLLTEQRYLCCYCEKRIGNNDCYIEHFRPKDKTQFPLLQLDYSNLHVSCAKLQTDNDADHCGHKKGNFFDSNLISPLDINCSTFFEYNLNGEISSSNTDKGQLTIQKLNLGSSLLNRSRKRLIDYFLFGVDSGDLHSEIDKHLDSSRSKYGEFHTMIEYLRNTKNL